MGVVDLRDKLSGITSQTPQATQVQETSKVQRRVASVVYNSSTVTHAVASTTAPAPATARPTATVKRPSNAMVPYAIPSLYFNLMDAFLLVFIP